MPVIVANDTFTGSIAELCLGAGRGAALLCYTNIGTRMELLVSGESIRRRLSAPGYVPRDSALYAAYGGNVATLSALELRQAVRAGDAFACAELDRITASFSIALANLLAVTGVTKVVIGGGVAKMGDVLFDRIRTKTDALAFLANAGRYEIVPGQLQDRAVLVGRC